MLMHNIISTTNIQDLLSEIYQSAFGDVRVDPLLTPMKPYSTLHSSIVNVTFKLSLPISNSPWPNQYHIEVSIRIYRFPDLEVFT